MVECGICLEEYQEGNLELHREICVLRLMFRCSLCHGDYVSKEGLWNHLDLHEIADESKELHYQEIKAKHKLHQCVLCNDQRAYSESPYWNHVHDVHDGFFLRCSDCGENFRSETLQNDHAFSHCKGRDQTEKDQVPIEDENRSEQSSNTNKEFNCRLIEHSRVNLNTANDTDNNIIDKKPELPTIDSAKSKDLLSRLACDICGITFSSKGLLLRHKRAKYTCMNGKHQTCPHCRRIFQPKEYQAHYALCEKQNFSCGLCPMKFQTSASFARHMRNGHRRKGVLNDEKQDQHQRKNFVVKTINPADKSTTHFSSDSSSSSNVVEGTAEKDIADNSGELLVENPSSRSSDTLSGTKCFRCDKECATARNLRHHIVHCHQPTTCSICGIIFEGSYRARHHKIKKHTKPKYECASCLKKFHFLRNYKGHLNICDPIQSDFSSDVILKDSSDPSEAAENPSSEASCTKCSHCGIKVSSAVTLTHHILIHHEPVACDFCGITLPSLSQAQRHKKVKHKESKFKCLHCSMQFFGSERLQKHASKCEKEKVPCEFCGKMFRTVFAVEIHKRKFCPAFKKSKERKQNNVDTLVESGSKCDYCTEEFSSPGHLIHHLQISHELTKCNICGITILGLSPTKNHKIKSHKEPKYKCTTCGKKFHHKRQFNAHCLECEHKMYSCKLCGRTFTHAYSIKRHNQRYHPEESSLENLQIIQNSDLEMEITVEEATLSARDDQGQSSNDGVSNSRSHEQPPNDDDSMDIESDRIDKMVSAAEKISQPLVENSSNHPFSCNICGIIVSSYKQISYHMVTKHTEERFQCPHCSRKFHFKDKLQNHESCCARLKYSCEMCGQKFNLLSRVKDHEKRVHHGNKPISKANIEGADCTAEQKQLIVKESDTAHQMTICIICSITFTSSDELMKHKLTCPKHAKEHYDRQCVAEEIPLIHRGKEAQPDSKIVPQGENIDLELNIKVEETVLQEQKYQVPNEVPGRSSVPTLFHIQHPHDGKSKHVKAEDAEDLENGIIVKEEYIEGEEEFLTERQTGTE
ncbi:zinc finger protein 761-like isoform X3 [Ochlerotatus camptorhynchus]|uniref:zinc finger protein 761-like isoform X3 n=1 Tax=Ochlerotatus camptorhynchus TaxID=644619 RepID=UPI0031DE30A6